MDDRKEVLPLRIVAARFINADKEIGLAELDRITADASRAIQKRYWIWTSSFMTTALVTAGAVLIGGALTVGKARGADLATLLGLGGAASMIAIGASWRVFQYGGMKARSPQSPVYADPSDLAVRNLERLFAILQLESTPRPFYYSRNGARRYVDHRYFFGKLRAAHSSVQLDSGSTASCSSRQTSKSSLLTPKPSQIAPERPRNMITPTRSSH